VVLVERSIEVAWFVAVTVAPTTTAPEESATVPVTFAVCAQRSTGVARIMNKTTDIRMAFDDVVRLFIVPSLFVQPAAANIALRFLPRI
jgi:hypothetical protein